MRKFSGSKAERSGACRDAARVSLLAAFVVGTTVAAEPRPTASPPPAPAKPVAAKPVAAKPLDLQPRNLERYFTRAQLEEPLQDPDDPDTVIVEGRRTDAPPDPEKRAVPGGIVAPFWALRHPTKAWRLFVPDPNAAPSGPPTDPVPPHRPFADP